jgi:hypothetical protein
VSAGYLFPLGALAVVVAVIGLAWFLVLRRLDEGNFEVGGPLHPPWKQSKAVSLGDGAADEHTLAQAWSADRQLEREEHAGSSTGIGDTRDRNAARAWGG